MYNNKNKLRQNMIHAGTIEMEKNSIDNNDNTYLSLNCLFMDVVSFRNII